MAVPSSPRNASSHARDPIATTNSCFAMRASEFCSEVKSNSVSRTSCEGTIALAQVSEPIKAAKSRQVCTRMSGKGLPVRFLSAKGIIRCSAATHSSRVSGPAAPALMAATAAGAAPAAVGDNGCCLRTNTQQAEAHLQTSFCGEAARATNSSKKGRQRQKKASPPVWADALAHASRPQSLSEGLRLPRSAATVCGNGASWLARSTPCTSGVRCKTRPSKAVTQRRTDSSQHGSASSRANCAGKPCLLRSCWPAGKAPKESISSTATSFRSKSSVRNEPITCL
mmetsp:Transcript_31990/g.62964  ORF Transcript_31990/g.62964 Transcript_31990/m.62964 type:complete len:283 (-) Transcript_31990:640-1488(-)